MLGKGSPIPAAPSGRLVLTAAGRLVRASFPLSDLSGLEPFGRRVVHTARWVAAHGVVHHANLYRWSANQLFLQAMLAIPRAEEVEITLGPPYRALGAPQDQPLLQSLMAHHDDVVLVTEAEPQDLPGPRVVYASPSFTDMTGYRVDEIIGRTPRILQGPGTERAALDAIREALASWQPVLTEVTNYRRDGSPFVVEMDIRPVADATGWITHWLSVQRDVTERRLGELRSLRMERLEAVAGLAAGVSHDFNNILVGVLGNLQMARAHAAPGSELDELLTDVEASALRARDLTRVLHAFARDEDGAGEAGRAQDPLEWARGAVESALAGRGVEVRVERRAPRPGRLRGDLLRLGRTLGGLALEQVSGLEGALRVEITLRSPEAGELDPRHLDLSRPFVVLELAGTGADPRRPSRDEGGRASFGVGLAVAALVLRRRGGAAWALPGGRGVAVALPVCTD